MTRPERRKVPLLGLQAFGFLCVLVAAWMIRDGWHVLGLVGVALLAAAEIAHRDR